MRTLGRLGRALVTGCEYQDLQSAKSHFKCLYSLRSNSCVPSVASQQSWSGKSDRAGIINPESFCLTSGVHFNADFRFFILIFGEQIKEP